MSCDHRLNPDGTDAQVGPIPNSTRAQQYMEAQGESKQWRHVWWVCGGYVVGMWWEYGGDVVGIWYVEVTRWVCGGNKVEMWREQGGYVEGTWWDVEGTWWDVEGTWWGGVHKVECGEILEGNSVNYPLPL